MRFNAISTDHVGSAICVLVGAGVLVLGVSYGVGTLHEMGSGFVPVTIGVLLILVGIAIAVTAEPRAQVPRFVDTHRGHDGGGAQWRGWLCIVGGFCAFVVLGGWGGLVPASFFSVLIAALGDRHNTLRSAAVLAATVTAFGVVVFHYLLSLSLPLFRWG